ncbi:MAG: hypothetical protein OEP95_15425 [Myxococcales bacterium]|nr:hypothetical protein [Myxococcales bacterium]
MRRLIILCALVLLVAPLGGCMFSHGQVDVLQHGDSFDKAQKRFSRLVKWGAWQKAVPMVAPDSREAFSDVMQGLAGVKFTDWEILVLDMGKGFQTATVEVHLEGFREATLTHHTAVMTQEWERVDTVMSTWQVKPDMTQVAANFLGR